MRPRAPSTLLSTPLSTLFASCLAFATPSILSCQGKDQAQDPQDHEATLVRAINDFSLDLYQRLAGDNKNLCISPASISTALLMAQAGARDKTLYEMNRVLRLARIEDGKKLTHLDGKDLRTAIASLLEKMNPPDPKAEKKKKGRRRFVIGTPAEIRVVNAMWGQEGYPFSDRYVKTLESSYRASVEAVDFLNKRTAARNAINAWVDKETKGKIKNLIAPGVLRPNTRLVLTNAVYFKGSWSDQFKKRATKPAKFHLEGADPVDVPTMHQTEGHGYFKNDDGTTVLQMGYSGRSHAMVILLPKTGIGLAAFEKTLTPARLRKLIGKLKHQSVRVALPKFKIESQMTLVEPLTDMGMELAFDPKQADFSGINVGVEPLWIDEILHKTYIDVDEEGTEAAAATAMMFAGRAAAPRPPVAFAADRPFVFCLRDVRTGLIVFMGRVMDPRG